MIACTRCGGNLDGGAAACPSCGARRPAGRGGRGFWIVAAVMALAAAGGGGIVLVVKHTAAARRAPPAAEPAAR